MRWYTYRASESRSAIDGDASIKIPLILFNNIWRTKEWPRDWKKCLGLSPDI